MAVAIDYIVPLASLAFGILVLVFPHILSYLVGIYLILIGILGLLIIL